VSSVAGSDNQNDDNNDDEEVGEDDEDEWVGSVSLGLWILITGLPPSGTREKSTRFNPDNRM
jgi:hypothetical protein